MVDVVPVGGVVELMLQLWGKEANLKSRLQEPVVCCWAGGCWVVAGGG